MPIDPILSLAFSIEANKGCYALLLGSGVSRAARIPTGWEITLDLIGKIAKMRGEDCGTDPAAWYKDSYGDDADYAKMLQAVGKTPADRASILKRYFEPTDEERERGEKLPTEAHHRIAELVSKGYVRVIVTTNFDHLIENALRQAAIEPVIISTADAVEGAPPLSQASSLIIKAHGDYLDARIKNTPKELARYDRRLNLLLDRVFDEFGLVVCGWSADWDTAMRAAIQRCKTHRFTTYWTQKDSISETTKMLVGHRRAEIVSIQGADTFFRDLAERVVALEEVARPHPLEAKVAVSIFKKYLADPYSKIKVRDMMTEVTEALYEHLSEKRYPISTPDRNVGEVTRRLRSYEADSEVFLNLLITGCYFGGGEYGDLWAKCLERIANFPTRPGTFFQSWSDLRKYPALLAMYAAGTAAIACGNYSTLRTLLTSPTVREGYYESGLPKTLILAVNIGDLGRILPDEGMRQVFDGVGWTGVPYYVSKVLRDPFRPVLPQDYDYEHCVDSFEYLLALVYADSSGETGTGWIPVGRQTSGKRDVIKQVAQEAAAGDDWPVLKAGFFGGKLAVFNRAREVVHGFYRRMGILN